MPTYDNAPLVILDGSEVDTGTQIGLLFSAGSEGSVVDALLINQFNLSGIRIDADNVTVRGCYIGTDGTGTSEMGNGTGIGVTGNNFTIGGTTAAERNIISGNSSDGVELLGGSNGVVQGNYIGTDVTGNFAIPNSKGISNYNGSHNNLIGGTTAGSGNVISGNTSVGIHIFGENFSTTIQGNLIGTNAAGVGPLANGGNGLHIVGYDNLIGGPTAADANTIAFNDEAGILVGGGTGNRFQRNSIYRNGGLGIDLDGDGVASNDEGDSDSGPNNLLNFSTITSATRTGGNVQIVGVYDGPANETLTLEFFSNIFVGTTNYGQGAFYLGQTEVTTNGSGHATFNVTFTITAGTLITATATDSDNNTSEFSAQARAIDTIITLNDSPLTVSHRRPVLIDPQATVTTSRDNYNDDQLLVFVSSGAQEMDCFMIKSFKDQESNKRVRYIAKKNQLVLGRQVLATVNSADGWLELTFSDNVRTSFMQDIVRNINLNSKHPGTRQVSFRIVESDGPEVSNVATRTINMT